MTVASETSRVQYVGAGTTGPFAVPYYFLADGDLTVVKTLTSDGSTEEMAITADYTVAGAGNPAGGSVTLVSALSSLYKLTIVRDPDSLQETDYQTGDPFPAESHERALDKLTMLVQRLFDKLARTLVFPDADGAIAGTDLPAAAARASRVLGFDATGLPAVFSAASAVTDSTTVTFLPTGTGAAPTDVQEALRVASYSGRVTMLRTGAATWSVLNEYGNAIDVSSSTTGGLQEAINYATTYGLNLLVIGGGTSRSADYGLINCTTGVTFPALRDMTVHMQGVHIEFSAAVTGVGLSFDSCMQLDFALVGEVVYQGASAAIQIKATNAIPIDTSTVVTGSRFYIGGVACTGSNPTACLKIDVSAGSVLGNTFDLGELQGSGGVGSPAVANYGLLITSPGVGTGFLNNVVDVANIHHVLLAGVQEGINTTNQANIANNIYRIGQLQPKGTNAQGWNGFGRNNQISIGSISSVAGGTIDYGIYTQSGSNANWFVAGAVTGAGTAAIYDSGLLNSFTHDGTTLLSQEARIAPTLAGTWANLGSGQPNAAYWKDSLGNVCLEGAVTGGGADTIFTLPAGYRPASTYLFPVTANNLFATVQITSAGVVSCTAHTAVVLNGIQFRP